MAFNSLEFIVFFVVVYGVYWATVRYARLALTFLLLASLLFYACWNPYYLILIVASSAVDFTVGAAVGRTDDPRRRKRLMLISIVYNLSVLATFKYFNWFMDSLGGLSDWADLTELIGFNFADAKLDFLLPVGISFFTFQSMSYTIDIYRRELDAIADYPRYLLYVSFFPQLVAGPIVRARDLLPQLAARPALTNQMAGRGLFLILLGLFKKIAIADYLAVNIVDRAFGMTAGYSSVEVLAGVYGYALQIYCDFSGYSDIAIGTALLLGFTFPENFNAPYKSRDLQEFWRRWHISLSTWLRDYLYIPLGGSRLGAFKTYRNLLITMLLGGLWHGAGWNFIIWGALHGGALAVLRAWQRARKRRRKGPLFPGMAGRVFATFLCFNYVCLAWIFFRATTFSDATTVLSKLAELTTSTANLGTQLLVVLAVGTVTHLWPRRWFDQTVAGFARLPASVQSVGVVAVALGLGELATSEVVPYIYFQF